MRSLAIFESTDLREGSVLQWRIFAHSIRGIANVLAFVIYLHLISQYTLIFRDFRLKVGSIWCFIQIVVDTVGLDFDMVGYCTHSSRNISRNLRKETRQNIWKIWNGNFLGLCNDIDQGTEWFTHHIFINIKWKNSKTSLKTFYIVLATSNWISWCFQENFPMHVWSELMKWKVD